MLETLTHEKFEPLIGQKFKLTSEDRTYEFELTDVALFPAPRRRSQAAASTRRAPFSVFFVGEPLLPQAMYPLQHDAFGSEPLNVFIVPVGPVQGRGYEYEAVFT